MCNCGKPQWVVVLPDGRRLKFISEKLATNYASLHGGRVERL